MKNTVKDNRALRRTFEHVEGLTDFDLRRPKRTCYEEYTVGEYGELVPATVDVKVDTGENFGGEEIKCSICLGMNLQRFHLFSSLQIKFYLIPSYVMPFI
jgi:hypothetical protein